jgi:hypothetical protein
MERSEIRGQEEGANCAIPDYAEFIIGPAEGRTRWLHPGYGGSPCSLHVGYPNKIG